MLPPLESAKRVVFRTYRRNAKTRGLEFTLTLERFHELMTARCQYCDIEPYLRTNKREAYGDYVHGGIDRVDNDEGYLSENCVPCCPLCNHAKKNMTLEAFQSWIGRLVEFHQRKEQ